MLSNSAKDRCHTLINKMFPTALLVALLNIAISNLHAQNSEDISSTLPADENQIIVPASIGGAIAPQVITDKDGKQVILEVSGIAFAPTSPQESSQVISNIIKLINETREEYPHANIQLRIMETGDLSPQQKQQITQSLERIRGEIKQADLQSIKLPPDSIASLEEFSSGLEKALDASKPPNKIKERLKHWFHHQKENVRYSLIRLSVNTSVVSIGLVVGGYPLSMALPVGLTAGALSGIFQLTHEIYLPWVAHKGLIKSVAQKIPYVSEKVAGAASTYIKWGSLEFFYLTAINLVKLSVGERFAVVNGFWEGLHILGTTIMTISAQAPWETYFHRRKEIDVAEALKENKDAKAIRKIEVNARRAILMTSLLSVSAAVSHLMNLPLVSYSIFGTMIVTGIKPEATTRFFTLQLQPWLKTLGGSLRNQCTEIYRIIRSSGSH